MKLGALAVRPEHEAILESELLKRSFREYIPEAWPHIENRPLIDNWHIGAIAEHLQAVSDGHITNLLINQPPGTSKSLLTAVLWMTWEWARRPQGQWFFASYDDQLSTRDSLKCRNLIKSRWYQARWGHAFRFAGDQNLKTRFENDKGGYRIATSVRGHGTGEHPDRIVIDDPHNPQKAESDTDRKAVADWWDQTLSTRGAAANVAARRVIIMQRLHQGDLSGHILEHDQGWTHLCLPMRYEPGRMRRTVIGFQDPRTVPGELLAQEQYPEHVVRQVAAQLKAYGESGQFQQRPTPAAGGMVKRHWWRYWKPKGASLPPVEVRCHRQCDDADCVGIHYIQAVELPDAFDVEIDSWDATFKKTEDADFVSGGHWARLEAFFYLLDRVCEQMDFTGTQAAIRAMRQKWKRTRASLVEDKANGPAVVNVLQRTVPGMIEWPVGSSSKEARMAAETPPIKSGNVFLPHPLLYPWVEQYVEILAAFPKGTSDDDVDMTSQALQYLQGGAWAAVGAAQREAVRGGKPATTPAEAHVKAIHDRLRDVLKKHEQNQRRGTRGRQNGGWRP